MRNRLVAALLAIFGGSVGAHKFYLRKPGTGFFYFFMFMVFLNARFPIMFLLGLFEGIGLLMMSDKDFNKKYNGGIQDQSASNQQEWNQRSRWNRPSQQPSQANQPQNRGWKNIDIPEYPEANRKNIYKESAIRKYKEFDLNGAIDEFKKSLQLESKDVATHFNIACAYSLTEQAQKAYYHLTKAIENGFNDFEKLNSHDDLAYVRIQNQWDGFKASGYRTYTDFEKDIEQPDEPNNVQQNEGLLDQLNKLNELRQKGLITEAEYVLEKKRLND